MNLIYGGFVEAFGWVVMECLLVVLVFGVFMRFCWWVVGLFVFCVFDVGCAFKMVLALLAVCCVVRYSLGLVIDLLYLALLRCFGFGL